MLIINEDEDRRTASSRILKLSCSYYIIKVILNMVNVMSNLLLVLPSVFHLRHSTIHL